MDKVREEFEVMLQEIGVATTRITVVECGVATTGYQSDEVNEMFGVFCFAWKASRAALCVELPSKIHDDNDDRSYGYDSAITDVEVSLDKAGVSYK